jgi:tetratricopeptide (TPR) repeat protein
MQKTWIRLLAGCLALLINFTSTSAVWAATSQKAIEPKFQGVPLQCYMTLADTGATPEARVAAYTEIAGKYADAQRLDQAKKVLGKSLTTAAAIADPSLKAFAFLDTAGSFTKLSQPKLAVQALDKSLTISKTLPDPVDRVFATIKIAEAYGEAGKKETAENLLTEATKSMPEIFNPYVRSRAFAAVANVYTTLGDDFQSESAISAATELLPMIEDGNARARAQVEITGSYAQAGNHAEAVASLGQTFRSFDDIRDQTIALAIEADKKTKENAKKPDSKLKSTLNSKVSSKTDSQEESQPSPDAEAVKKSAIATAEKLKMRSLFLVTGQYLASKQYEKALEVIGNLDDNFVEKSIGLANVAIAYVKDKKIDVATPLFEQSVQSLTKVASSIDAVTLLIEVARQYQTIKLPELAIKAWDQALAIGKNLPQPAERLFALNTLASNYAEFGLNDKVPPILEESLALAKTAPDINIRSRAFADVSNTYWAIGQRDRAKEVSQTIENPLEKEQLTKLFACAS